MKLKFKNDLVPLITALVLSALAIWFSFESGKVLFAKLHSNIILGVHNVMTDSALVVSNAILV